MGDLSAGPGETSDLKKITSQANRDLLWPACPGPLHLVPSRQRHVTQRCLNT